MIAVRGLEKRSVAGDSARSRHRASATGETLVIIGRSGGGKSVLLKNLIGLMQPDSGEIWIDGQNIIGLGERQLAADPAQSRHSVSRRRALRFDDASRKISRFHCAKRASAISGVIAQKIAEMLEVIELEGQQKKMPVNLSGGMKKRVGLARAIISRPSCILYDEPTAGTGPGGFRQHQPIDPPAAGALSTSPAWS